MPCLILSLLIKCMFGKHFRTDRVKNKVASHRVGHIVKVFINNKLIFRRYDDRITFVTAFSFYYCDLDYYRIFTIWKGTSVRGRKGVLSVGVFTNTSSMELVRKINI